MTRWLLLFALIVSLSSPLLAQQELNGQKQLALTSCLVAHGDSAVNLVTTVTTNTPPTDQFVYVCGIDLSVSNDSTGAVTQANVKFTSTNLRGWVYEYSSVNAANTNGLDKIFYPPFAIQAGIAGQPVQVISPAINAHAAYSINIYYYFGPGRPQ